MIPNFVNAAEARIVASKARMKKKKNNLQALIERVPPLERKRERERFRKRWSENEIESYKRVSEFWTKYDYNVSNSKSLSKEI